MTSKEIRSIARENLTGNWGISVGTTLVAALLGGMIAGVGSGLNFNFNEDTIRNLPRVLWGILLPAASFAGLLGLVSFIIGGTVELGYAKFLLKQHDGQPLDFSDLFSQFDRFGAGFAQAFLRGLYTALWSLLFIIPGIIAALRYAMTPYIMAEHPELTASEGIQRSKELMEGHKMDLFILELTFLGWDILCALTLNIGNLALNPYKNAALTVFYRNITAQK